MLEERRQRLQEEMAEVQMLENELANMTATHKDIEYTKGTLIAQITDLNIECESLEEEVVSLHQVAISLRGQIDDLKDRYTALATENAYIQKDISTFHNSISTEEAKYATLRKKLDEEHRKYKTLIEAKAKAELELAEQQKKIDDATM